MRSILLGSLKCDSVILSYVVESFVFESGSSTAPRSSFLSFGDGRLLAAPNMPVYPKFVLETPLRSTLQAHL